MAKGLRAAVLASAHPFQLGFDEELPSRALGGQRDRPTTKRLRLTSAMSR